MVYVVSYLLKGFTVARFWGTFPGVWRATFEIMLWDTS